MLGTNYTSDAIPVCRNLIWTPSQTIQLRSNPALAVILALKASSLTIQPSALLPGIKYTIPLTPCANSPTIKAVHEKVLATKWLEGLLPPTKDPTKTSHIKPIQNKQTRSTLSTPDNALHMAKTTRMPVFIHQGNSSTEFKYTVTDRNGSLEIIFSRSSN